MQLGITAESLLYIILGILVVDFIFESILDWLNNRNIKKELPGDIAEFYNREKYELALEYQKTNNRFGLLTGTLSFIATLLILAFGGFGWLDNMLRQVTGHEIFLPLLYFFVLYFVSDILTLPIQLYRVFVIENRFGFNTMTPRLFVTDKIKGYLLTIVLGGILGGILIWLIVNIGPDFWIYFLAISILFIILIQLFYSTIILPLFNKLTPLEDGELKSAISDYSKKVDFSLTNIFVIDGSKRSKKANAFFMGFGKKKKVVLYDTLIQNHSQDELVAVLAHEIGHYKKKHIIGGMITSVISVALTLFILSLIVYNETLSLALGGEQLAIHLNLLAFGILYSPISKITGILVNMLSRKNEFAADHYAKSTYSGEALKTALKKLSVDNLSNLYPHPAYVFVHYSHPPLLERLKALG